MTKYIKLEDVEKRVEKHVRNLYGTMVIDDARAILADLPTIEVSEDCISRRQVKEQLQAWCTNLNEPSQLVKETAFYVIDTLPSVIPSRPRGEWILCSEKMPEVEKKVWVQTRSGEVTPAMYEDGTVSEVDSLQSWYDVEWDEWDEKNGCMIVPKGWWAASDFLPDSEYGYPIDEEVIAWMPPELYRAEGKESQDD